MALLGVRAISAGASGSGALAARRLCAQAGDDREQVLLDDAVLPAVLGLADQGSGPVELPMMFRQELKKRGLPSPDRAEALIMSFVQRADLSIDVESHKGESLIGNFLNMSW